MKMAFKVGDKVKVTDGKDAGKEAKVVFIDSKSKRVRLEGLKVSKVKTKKGDSKDLHGTYHIYSLEVIKEEPKAEAPAEAAAAEA